VTLEQLLELSGKATQGPFSIERRDDDCGYMNHIVHGGKGDYAWCRDELDPAAKQNAAFIAAASGPVVRALVEAVQAAGALRSFCNDFRSAGGYVSDFDSAMARLNEAMKGEL